MTSSAHRVSRLLAIRQRGVWSHAKVEGFPKPLDNGRPTHGETNGRATVPRPPRSHEASSGGHQEGHWCQEREHEHLPVWTQGVRLTQRALNKARLCVSREGKTRHPF